MWKYLLSGVIGIVASIVILYYGFFINEFKLLKVLLGIAIFIEAVRLFFNDKPY